MEYYYSEREYWNNQIIGKYITLPTECTNCKYSNIHLIEKPTLNNPFLMKCSKCGKIIYLRSYTIFGLFPRTPVSLIDKIIKYWLLNKLNASKIFEKLTKNDNIKLRTDQTIRNILDIIRQCIAHYLYDKYYIRNISGGK